MFEDLIEKKVSSKESAEVVIKKILEEEVLDLSDCEKEDEEDDLPDCEECADACGNDCDSGDAGCLKI